MPEWMVYSKNSRLRYPLFPWQNSVIQLLCFPSLIPFLALPSGYDPAIHFLSHCGPLALFIALHMNLL